MPSGGMGGEGGASGEAWRSPHLNLSPWRLTNQLSSEGSRLV